MDLEELQAIADAQAEEIKRTLDWTPVARHPALQSILDRVPEPTLSEADHLPHWRCDDCGQPCFCAIPWTDHHDCGVRGADWSSMGESSRSPVSARSVYLSQRDPSRPLDPIEFGE